MCRIYQQGRYLNNGPPRPKVYHLLYHLLYHQLYHLLYDLLYHFLITWILGLTLMICAALSAITVMMALGAGDGKDGNTEASITLMPVTPRTLHNIDNAYSAPYHYYIYQAYSANIIYKSRLTLHNIIIIYQIYYV